MRNSKISVVIPFYNEENELDKLLFNIRKFENKSNQVNEYLFIDDCSNDNSLKILENFKKKQKILISQKIIIIKNKVNLGWAKTLKKGYKKSKSELTLFIPGDGEADLNQFLRKFDPEFDVIIFQRKDMGSRPFLRKIISKLYKYLICKIFFIKVLDLNGLIMIKTKKINKLRLFSNSFFISAEIILKSHLLKLNIDRNKNFKLLTKNKYKSSSLNFRQLFLTLFDICKMILFCLNVFFKAFIK